MVFKTKKKYQIENMQLQYRIKELEQLLCPAEQHNFVKVSRTTYIIDAYGSTLHDDKYVCSRCLKVKTETDYS